MARTAQTAQIIKVPTQTAQRRQTIDVNHGHLASFWSRSGFFLSSPRPGGGATRRTFGSDEKNPGSDVMSTPPHFYKHACGNRMHCTQRLPHCMQRRPRSPPCRELLERCGSCVDRPADDRAGERPGPTLKTSSRRCSQRVNIGNMRAFPLAHERGRSASRSVDNIWSAWQSSRTDS